MKPKTSKTSTSTKSVLKAELEALAAMPDEDIDTSDIPELDDAFWEKAVVGKFYRPIKKQVTVRIDADVLAWLKSSGSGYQTRLNPSPYTQVSSHLIH